MNKPAILSIDFETRSDVDLKKCGVDVYAESPTTRRFSKKLSR